MLHEVEEFNVQGVFKSIIQFHNGSLVATAIAVVWRTEDCDNISVMTPVVALGKKTKKHCCNEPSDRI